MNLDATTVVIEDVAPQHGVVARETSTVGASKYWFPA
jgi:hypothetical protein